MVCMSEQQQKTRRGVLARALAALRSRWARHAAYRLRHRQLSALSRDELEALGIERHMISRLAREAADRAGQGIPGGSFSSSQSRRGQRGHISPPPG